MSKNDPIESEVQNWVHNMLLDKFSPHVIGDVAITTSLISHDTTLIKAKKAGRSHPRYFTVTVKETI